MLNPRDVWDGIASINRMSLRIDRLEEDLNVLESALSAVRTELSDVRKDIAVLQEGRKTIDEQVRRVMTEQVLDLQMKYGRAAYQGELPPSKPPRSRKTKLDTTEPGWIQPGSFYVR